MKVRILLLVSLVFFLSACGPIYQTQYSYKPPKSSMGRMCAAQCIQNKSNCEQMCQIREESCRTKARQDALYQYELYKAQQQVQSQPVKKTPQDFENTWGCHQSCDCGPAYNACYETCGGQVIATQVCTAFCDRK